MEPGELWEVLPGLIDEEISQLEDFNKGFSGHVNREDLLKKIEQLLISLESGMELTVVASVLLRITELYAETVKEMMKDPEKMSQVIELAQLFEELEHAIPEDFTDGPSRN